jgi:hypothetical protein
MAALKALKAFFAEVKEEFEAGWQFVKFILRELWWAAVLAAVFYYCEGGTGGAKDIVKATFMIRFLKIPFEVLHIMKYDMQHYLQGILEKLSYVERRLMRENYGTGDATRQLGQDMEAYEPFFGNRRWLQRRLRSHFEDWMKAADTTFTGMQGTIRQRLKMIWSMVCSEVQLRACRDIVASRANAAENGVQQKGEKVAKQMKILANLKIGWCTFWKPVKEQDWHDMENLVPEHYLELCLQSQLVERKEELQEIADNAKTDADKEALFVGMPDLVKSFVKMSGSSGGAVVREE